MNTEREKEQKRRDWLYELHIKENHERYRYNAQSYDKSILTLSSTSLGFSLLVIKYIVPLECASHKALLVISWGLLLLSIASSLVAYIFANKSLEFVGANITDEYLHGRKGALARKTPYTKYSSWLNPLTGASFVAAIILIVLFVALNVPI